MKTGESLRAIYDSFPFWFCPQFEKYSLRNETPPFDQHFLLAALSPRFALVGSASEDGRADPVSEFLACAAASPAFERDGVTGLSCPDRLPRVDEEFFGGHIEAITFAEED